MHGRILFGVVAWLLGAATATAGSLLAVSLLGQGITGATGPLLSQVAVNRALASEAAEPTPGAASSGTTSPGGTHAASGAGEPSSGAPSSGAASSAGASPSDAPSGTPAATPSPSGTADDGTSGGGTVLSSRGGNVVAGCQAGGAYLDSWSPAQGFVVGDVHRGPAQTARVTFDPASGSSVSAVTMLVSCSAGVPSATTHSWTGDE